MSKVSKVSKETSSKVVENKSKGTKVTRPKGRVVKNKGVQVAKVDEKTTKEVKANKEITLEQVLDICLTDMNETNKIVEKSVKEKECKCNKKCFFLKRWFIALLKGIRILKK